MISLIPYDVKVQGEFVFNWLAQEPSVYKVGDSYEEKRRIFRNCYNTDCNTTGNPHVSEVEFYNGDDLVLTVYLNIFRNSGRMYKTVFKKIDTALLRYERNQPYMKIIFAPQKLEKEIMS